MTNAQIGDEQLELVKYISQIENKVSTFLDAEIRHWSEIDECIEAPLIALREFFAGGGKRLRPAFCYLGYVASGGEITNSEIIDAGCTLEILHTFALVHDDFMDKAETRRGLPTVHKYLEQFYSEKQYKGDIKHFSNSVAILAGDFAFTYADRFARSLPVRCLDIYDLLKVELFAGQQMDLDAVYRNQISKKNISLIAQYKSGKYTIERPIHLGALLANKQAPLDLWSRFGEPLGEAFQLRDDILGVFGDTQNTGKPVGDDIREGKYTLLIAEAIENASDTQKSILERRGSTDISASEIDQIAEIIESTGALKNVETKISELYDESLEALDKIELEQEVYDFANYMARYVCWRES